ncbi:MAG: tetratricopeptide repeat protein [Cyanobacteria bacterium J06632_22]
MLKWQIAIAGLCVLCGLSPVFDVAAAERPVPVAQRPPAQLTPYQEAEQLYQAGLRSYQAGGAAALREAIELWQQALPLWQSIDAQREESITLNNIGRVYAQLGDGETALGYFQQALSLSQALGDPQGEAITLNNIGHIYDDIGDRDSALDFYQQALSLIRTIGDRRAESITLNNIGGVYNDLGEKETALDYYQQALALRRTVGDSRGEATILNNMGGVYSSLGQSETALEYYQQALTLRQEANDPYGQAVTLNNLGHLYDELEDRETALDYYQQALALRQALGDRRGEATTLNNIGLVYNNLEERETALDYYQQALALGEAVGNRQLQASTLNNIGRIYDDLGEPTTALDYYQQSLPLSQAIGDRQGEVVAHGNIAALYFAQNQFEASLIEINRAIALIEDLRTDIGSGELRASYFATVQDYYQLKMLILMRSNRPEAAFETSEAARARLLTELLSEANVDIRTGVDAALLAEEKTLQQKLSEIENRRIRLRSGDYAPEAARTLDDESNRVLQQLDQVLAQIRQSSPAYAETVSPQPLALAQIQQTVLDEETVLLQYALGERESYLWIVGQEQFQAYVLPEEGAISTLTERFIDSVALPKPTGLAYGTGKALAAEILPDLPDWAKDKRLLVAADGLLSEVPFGALPLAHHESYTPLLAEHEVLLQPSISAIAVLRQQLSSRTEPSRSIAILADPVYRSDDARLGNPRTPGELPTIAQQNLRDFDLRVITRLPYTREEADQILGISADIHSTVVYGFDATYDWVTQTDLTDYSILHLATHGFVNSVNPQLSGLVLALVDSAGNTRSDGFLRLHDIFNLQLSAELVVLSACQTGLGANVSGEGIIGLSRGFMYAGAERVAVSLWNVNDQATAELMTAFYGYMLQNELSPAAALRAAQLQQWEAGQMPFLWAAFTLQGEWR